MIDRSITIANVNVILTYAFRAISSEGTDRIAAQRFDHLHDLLAEILIRGVGAQVKRGLHHDYLTHGDELATVRGRINITRTIADCSVTRGRLVCEFDEYQMDTPHNRALKSVIVLLIRQGDVELYRKAALRRLLPYLDAVTLVPPRSIRWGNLTYHRANASYRLLLGVCQLVVQGLLPTEDAGANHLKTWMPDEAMSDLFERFVREYYKFHHPELSPSAVNVAWDLGDTNRHGEEQLPKMRTDVTLRSGQRKLIIDAKYYSHSMQTGRWGKATLHSGHLYQILTYTKNADTHRTGSVGGLLLYASTNEPELPALDIVVQGNRVGARNLDLDQPWEHLRAQLEDIIHWLEIEPAGAPADSRADLS